MSDLRTSLLHRIDGSLDTMFKAPRMWGSPESLELQALLLIELKCLILRPHMAQQNPSEMRDVYERFVESAFVDSPATLLSYTLRSRGEQSELPRYLRRFRNQVEGELPEENPYEHNDMVLDIEIRSDRDIPAFSKICGYYERFMKALRAIVRQVPKESTDPRDAVARSTEYPVPEIRVMPGKDGYGTLIRIPLEQPKFGQLNMERESLSEQRVREAIGQAMGVVTWAEDAAPIMSNLRKLFPADEQRKVVAAQTIRMLPEQGIDAVRIGGKLLGRAPIELRPSQAPRIVPVLQEGEVPKDFSCTGNVRAVDLDQKWFRLKYGSTTVKCWVNDAPEYLDIASQALASKGKVTVKGDEFRAAYRRPFVVAKNVAAETRRLPKLLEEPLRSIWG